MKEETLKGGPKSRRKEELGEEEWVSLNTLSSRRPRYDKTTQLPRTQERRRDEVFSLHWYGRGGGLFSSGEENMNGRSKNLEPRPYFSFWGNREH